MEVWTLYEYETNAGFLRYRRLLIATIIIIIINILASPDFIVPDQNWETELMMMYCHLLGTHNIDRITDSSHYYYNYIVENIFYWIVTKGYRSMKTRSTLPLTAESEFSTSRIGCNVVVVDPIKENKCSCVSFALVSASSHELMDAHNFSHCWSTNICYIYST